MCRGPELSSAATSGSRGPTSPSSSPVRSPRRPPGRGAGALTRRGAAPCRTRFPCSTANARYAAAFDKGDLAIAPVRRIAVLTCLDARLDPARFARLAEGDAHVIRNAGGCASDDAFRSLVIAHKLLGTRTVFVIHPTACGMALFTDVLPLLPGEGARRAQAHRSDHPEAS